MARNLQKAIEWRAYTAHRWLWSHTRCPRTTCDHEGIFISSREDRYGSNSIPWLNAVAMAFVTEKQLFHNCSVNCYRYRNHITHRILMQHSIPCMRCYECDLIRSEGWFRGQHKRLIESTGGQTLLQTIANSRLKDEFFGFYDQAAKSKAWMLPAPAEKLLTIHVRLDDLRDEGRPELQEFIGDTQLCELIRFMNSEYPTHHLHLATSPNLRDVERCREIAEHSRISCSVGGHENEDQDLWIMMNSDILVMSKSTFPLIAALLHQGTRVASYTDWQVLRDFTGRFDPNIPVPAPSIDILNWNHTGS